MFHAVSLEEEDCLRQSVPVTSVLLKVGRPNVYAFGEHKLIPVGNIMGRTHRKSIAHPFFKPGLTAEKH